MTPELFFGNTDTGRMRSNNEDSFIAESLGKGHVLACVIDGVGGYEGGEVAASIARDTILEVVRPGEGDLQHLLKRSFILANERIYSGRMNNPVNSSMACVLTLVLADLENNQFVYAHVGDTRLYLLRDHTLVKLTRDHSFVGFLEDNKKLTEEEAMKHPKRNEVNKALGFDPNMASVADYIETGISPFLPGDLLLLCSDGLSDLVDNRAMASILTGAGTLSEKTDALISAANEAGGKDNITVVLVHNNKKPLKQRATKPVLVKKKDVPKKSGEQEEVRSAEPVIITKRNNGLVIFLFILCLLLGGAAYWLYSNRTEPVTLTSEETFREKKPRLPAEQGLADSLNLSPLLVLGKPGQPSTIIISDTLWIDRDSLHIQGNGTTLRSDTAYQGAAFLLQPSTRYLMLENLVMEGFDLGILARNKSLHLKNVRFVQCRVPVRYDMLLPQDMFINGSMNDSLLFRTDSLPN